MTPKLMFARPAIILSVAVMAGITLTGCSDEENGDIQPITVEYSKVTQTEFAAHSNDFANNLLAELAEKTEVKGGNVIVSPISMQYLLSMMANTASEEAQQEVLTTLGLNGYTMTETNEYSKQLLDRLQQDDKYVQVALSNSIWAAQNVSFTADMETAIKNYYNADIVKHDFVNKPDEAVRLMGQWASKNTQGMITQVPCTPTANTMMVLANATFFNGKWSQPFNGHNTTQQPFYNEDGSTSSVPMMSSKMTAMAYADQDVSVVELTYGRGYYGMMIVMPTDIKEQISDKTDWWGLHNKLMKSENMEILLPRFKVKNDWGSMIDVCRSLGINKLFDEGPIGMPNGLGTKFMELGQSTVIEVEENGTKAASVSSGMAGFTSPGPPTKLCFDHPFIYAVRENTTGTILFVGKVGKL